MINDETAQGSESPEIRYKLFTEIFHKTYQRLRNTDSAPPCEIQFFRYKNIKNTLRVRDGLIRVRISHMLMQAPPEVIGAVFEILLCRTYRLRSYEEANLLYNHYINSPEFLANTSLPDKQNRQILKLGTEGKTANLDQRFEHLNNQYFEGNLRSLSLNWTERKSRKILGQFIPHRDEILINSILDHPLVPVSVIDFILYHEMLHAFLDIKISATGRKLVHNPDFKQKERKFEGYKFASEFIRENF